MKQQPRFRTVVFVAMSLGVATLSFAQTFPSKLVKITAPYSAGAAPAVFTRAMADKLSKLWGQPVIVEAKPGASGFIAIEAVKNAAPDGHELLVVSDAHVAINPALYKRLPYDPQRDFVPVAMFYHTPFYLAVATAGPYPHMEIRCAFTVSKSFWGCRVSTCSIAIASFTLVSDSLS
jgi:tripartite-type tricarboxylate transporter receptor subunit TctC